MLLCILILVIGLISRCKFHSLRSQKLHLMEVYNFDTINNKMVYASYSFYDIRGKFVIRNSGVGLIKDDSLFIMELGSAYKGEIRNIEDGFVIEYLEQKMGPVKTNRTSIKNDTLFKGNFFCYPEKFQLHKYYPIM